MAKARQPDGRESLADRLNRLFELHPTYRGPYSNEEVAAAITATGGAPISASYLWLLRTGRRDNPTVRHLEALGDFFAVPPAYFFDDARALQLDQELGAITAMRDAGVMPLALRAYGLPADDLTAVATVLDQLRKAHGLPPVRQRGTKRSPA